MVLSSMKMLYKMADYNKGKIYTWSDTEKTMVNMCDFERFILILK